MTYISSEIVRSRMFFFFLYFAEEAEHNTTTAIGSVTSMAFNKAGYLDYSFIKPPKCQSNITQSPTKLVPKKERTTGMYVEGQGVWGVVL